MSHKFISSLLLMSISLIGYLTIHASTGPLPERGLCAHRGASATHPENTLPAFIEAARLGAQMIEFDIQLTKDSVLVLMHDETVDRTTNGKGKVADLTLSEIKQLDAGSWKGIEFKDTKIPTLEEALAVMPATAWLNCHLKGEAAAAIKAAITITQAGKINQTFLACGEAAAMAARKINPSILICNMESRYRKNLDDYAQSTISMKAGFLQLITDGKGTIPAATSQLLKSHNIRINYFYGKDSTEITNLFKTGVNFVLVDDIAKFMPIAHKAGIASVPRQRSLILIFDGLRPDYITPENMPNLYALRSKGAYGTNNHSIIPTVTRVNASSYSTGSYPATHGIMGNTVYFPQVDKTKGLNTGEASELLRIDNATHGHLLTTVSVGELIQSAGDKMMVFSSGTSGQALLQNTKVNNGAIINPDLILPESFKPEVLQALGAPPPYTKPNTRRHQWATDAFCKYGLASDGPAVSAVWLSDPDATAHATGVGSPLTMEAIKSVDWQLGRMLDSMKSKGLLDSYNIIISSDHGFVTNIGKESLLSFLLKQGLKKDSTSDDVIITDGAIYVKDHNPQMIQKIVTALQEQQWIGALFTRSKKSGDMKGSIAGTLSFESVYWNHADRAADILAIENWNDDSNQYGYKGTGYAKGIAGHGGSSPYEIHIPLIVSGPAFKKGHKSELPTSNVDIVPTLLHIHNINIPVSMNGRVLSEFLSSNTEAQAKSSIEKFETSVQHAWGTYQLIIERSVLGNYKYVNYTKTLRDFKK